MPVQRPVKRLTASARRRRRDRRRKARKKEQSVQQLTELLHDECDLPDGVDEQACTMLASYRLNLNHVESAGFVMLALRPQDATKRR